MPPKLLDAQQELVRRLEAALPQTQCTRCGYPDCAAYARAITAGEAGINQCPPGGAEGVARLAALTGQPALPLNPAHGSEGPRSLAVIDEDWCIGCTLCLEACPTDAIVGSNKRMHTVIEPHCTGCALCVPVCPVDCIMLEPVTGQASGWAAWSPEQAAAAQQRYSARLNRMAGPTGAQTPTTSPPSAPATANNKGAAPPHRSDKQSTIAAALARARQLRGDSGS